MDKNKIDFTMKIVLIGDLGVGKTNIINRFVLGKFIPCSPATYNPTYFNKTIQINNESIILELWDRPGAEQYRSLDKLFYKDADAIIFVYDITNEYQYKDFKNYVTSILKGISSDVSKKK